MPPLPLLTDAACPAYFLTPHTSPPNATTFPSPSNPLSRLVTSSSPNGNPPITIMRIIIRILLTGMFPCAVNMPSTNAA